jgi:hypothetical protein
VQTNLCDRREPANASSLYLAVLIGRSKSTHSYAFLRLLANNYRCFPRSITHKLHHSRDRDLHSPGGGPCVPSRSALGPSHTLHLVRRQGCPSSQTLPSSKGGSRQEKADIPHFAAPPGDAHRARGSLSLLLFNMLGANPASIRCHLNGSYRAGFNRSRCVTLAPKPTWKSVSLTHIRCRIPASFRATAVIAHSMLDRLAIRGPHSRKADHFLTRSGRLAAASQSASRTAISPCLVMRLHSQLRFRTGVASGSAQNAPTVGDRRSAGGHPRQP